MRIIELVAGSKVEAEHYKGEFRRLGENPVVSVIRDAAVGFEMPAVRTAGNLYEGEAAVTRVLDDLGRNVG